MIEVYLLLGGNMGNRERYLAEARQLLAAGVGPITAASGLYETAAWGLTEQPAFLNQVLQLQTALSAPHLLQLTQSVELQLGRIRKEKWGARVVDIDILFYGQQVLNLETLVIPHPQLHLRRFTLVPLAELAPLLRHPVLGLTIAELISVCPDQLPVVPYSTRS